MLSASVADTSIERTDGRAARAPTVRAPPTAPTPRDAKGSVKFWVKDGQLTKFEVTVRGKITVGEDKHEVDISQTSTVEIKDVGSTRVVVPAEAKKKLMSR